MAKKNDSTQKKINSKIDAHDKQHTRNAKKRQKKVEKMFDEATKKASIIASATSGTKDSFELSKEPAARKRIDEVIMQLNEDLSATIINGDKEEWLLSANKNDAMVDYLAQQTNLPSETISQWKSRNLDALEAFQQRKIEGMNLSTKVWNITDQFKGELEMAIDVALGNGVSAAAMSRTVRKLLNNPTALFRRVRDKNGQIRLSQNAKNYHPGRGVYRSAYRNALRLTATETNMAYRTADHTRWQQLNFVTGIEIKLSNNHNCRGIAKGQFYDICDELAGIYPKDFKFVGWHPFCRCFAVPKLADMDEFLKYQDRFVAGEDVSGYKFSGEVTQMPKQFNEWVKNNEKRIKSAKSLPYFLRDNLSKLNKEIYTLSEKASVEKALKNERKRLLRQRSEVMTIIGKNGQILTSVEGTFGNVYFNDEIAKKIKDNIITHNHPRSIGKKGLLGIGRSLSDDDIFTAINCNARSIVAETQLYRYTAMRNGNSWSVSVQELKKRYAEVFDELFDEYKKQLSVGDRTILLQHLTMKRLSKEFGFTYSYERI